MALEPGQQTTLTLRFMMHAGMAGPHDFRVFLPSNDARWGERTLTVLSNWVDVPPR